MLLAYYDEKRVSDRSIKKTTRRLDGVREEVANSLLEQDKSNPLYALSVMYDDAYIEECRKVAEEIGRVKHLVVVGIGGSSAGIQAIYDVLRTESSPTLSVLSDINVDAFKTLCRTLDKYKSVDDVSVCVISKSGTTTETLVNAEMLLEYLVQKFGEEVYKRFVFISTAQSDLLTKGRRLGAHLATLPESVSGRFSILTSVGQIPMHLLELPMDTLMDGARSAGEEDYDKLASTSAARLYRYYRLGYIEQNVFIFSDRLLSLGRWYQQLFCETLGKTVRLNGRKVNPIFNLTISTARELHSTAQLYFSGRGRVFFDFYSLVDTNESFLPTKTRLDEKYSGHSLEEIESVIYAGVQQAMKTMMLPFSTTTIEEDRAYSLGLFLSIKMREAIYLAHLMDVDAFNQPNVEIYKKHVREILF